MSDLQYLKSAEQGLIWVLTVQDIKLYKNKSSIFENMYENIDTIDTIDTNVTIDTNTIEIYLNFATETNLKIFKCFMDDYCKN